MKHSALCLVDTEEQADSIVGKLRGAGFSENDISVLFPDKGDTRDFAHKKETKMPEGATVGAGTGGVVGATIGLLAGLGALAIPGIGPFIAAGPIIAALSGGAIGAGVGGLAGALVGLGIPEYEAKQYEGKVKEGGILISVHSENGGETRRAKDIFEVSGARDISSTGELPTDLDPDSIATTQSGLVVSEEVPFEPAAPELKSELYVPSLRPSPEPSNHEGIEKRVAADEIEPSYHDAALLGKPTREEIAIRAHEIFQRRGSNPGHETEDWLAAERELIEEFNLITRF
jgi:hypothetical protein